MRSTRLTNDKVSFTPNDILFSVSIETNMPERVMNDKEEKLEVDQ